MAQLETPEQAESLITKVYDACQAIRESDVVTIAHIEGPVFGAGLELVASCDFRYATDTARFAMPEVELGIPSVVQARLLANIIGWQKTKYLVYTGATIDAQTAADWGLVDVLCPSSELALAQTMRAASKIAENGPEAMKAQKRLVRLWEEQDLASGVTAGIESFSGMFRDGAVEPKEYMQRFFEKRAALKRQAAAA
ncbi:uncharacterized protein A1O5_12109 [Cladophialophora psammophila CBS 110553]|uniref:Enoyl-CoA hydratase n=1 Tax=Cladophialophora psammophila CBS 110553 TaxID=1182543 RepID=W9WM19_9EURO|nr:uncharacterized protein A1O5_12109 [Cladophialophora psammophila CBS 110553]EXJ59484.1 hypothetical protein A1O5_12109 [Cladophialophora psammophila CBS 110553]